MSLTTSVVRWKYMRTLLADGNFKQEHLRMKYPEDDVPLSDGHGYMVGKADFDQYIEHAPDPGVQVCLPPRLTEPRLTPMDRNPPVMSTMRSRVRIRLVPISTRLELVQSLALVMDVSIPTRSSIFKRVKGMS